MRYNIRIKKAKEMKRTLLLALVLGFLPHGIVAQEAIIEVDPRIFDNAVRSLLLISDKDGVVHFEEELAEPGFSENYRLHFTRDPEVGAYHFTIFNEYISEKINIGYRYYRACTYYDIADELTADNYYDFGPGPELEVETREVLIGVNGVDELNEFIVHASTPLNYERAKVRKGRCVPGPASKGKGRRQEFSVSPSW